MQIDCAEANRIRVLYSFHHKIGAARIGHTAWQQVRGLAKKGADVLVFPGASRSAARSRLRLPKTNRRVLKHLFSKNECL